MLQTNVLRALAWSATRHVLSLHCRVSPKQKYLGLRMVKGPQVFAHHLSDFCKLWYYAHFSSRRRQWSFGRMMRRYIVWEATIFTLKDLASREKCSNLSCRSQHKHFIQNKVWDVQFTHVSSFLHLLKSRSKTHDCSATCRWENFNVRNFWFLKSAIPLMWCSQPL